MTIFSDIIERKNRLEKHANLMYEREKEAKQLFNSICKKHKLELRQHFSKVKISQEFLSIDGYNIAFGACEPCLYIGYCASGVGGDVKLYIDYTWSDVKLHLTFKNALRMVVSMAYRPGVKLKDKLTT